VTELRERKSALLQFTVIVLMSVAASYAFQHTETVYKFNGLCIYRYIAYSAAVLFGYLCFSCYKRIVGLAFSLTLSVVVLSPIGSTAIELFVLFVPLLAALMGTTVILAFPDSQKKGFFEFLFVLILPSLLTESRISGSASLIATTESPGYLALSAITVCIVGGYFCLKYATLANINRLALLSSGAGTLDVAQVSRASNNIVSLIVMCACGTAFSLMVATPIFGDALRGTFFSQPIYVVASALGLALALTALLYIFQLYGREAPRTIKE
jgi:hypothetical protein